MREHPQALLHSVDEAAEIIGVSKWQIFAMLRSGELTGVKIGRRRLIPHAALVAYVDKLVAEAS